MKKSEWVATLKAGDTVAIVTGFRGEPSIHRVARVTPSGRVLVDVGTGRLSEFNIDGYSRGSHGYSRPFLQEATPEMRERAFRASAVPKLHNTNWASLSTDAIRAALAIARPSAPVAPVADSPSPRPGGGGE